MSDTPAPKSFPYKNKVLDWSDERGNGDRIIVTLTYGWAFEPSECSNTACHVRGFDNVTEARKEMKLMAQPCPCSRCHPENGEYNG